MEVSETCARCKSPATHLNRNHSERVNIRFLAGILATQDLRRRPQRSVDVLTRSRPYRVQVFCDNGNAEIGNARMGYAVIHVDKDVDLRSCKCSDEMGFGKITYTFEISVDHIPGMQVAEARRDLR